LKQFRLSSACFLLQSDEKPENAGNSPLPLESNMLYPKARPIQRLSSQDHFEGRAVWPGG
jgi:hypothetical protein